MQNAEPVTYVSEDQLARFIAAALTATGLRETDADTAAALMAEADAWGADGHGVFRLASIVKRIRSGGINTHPTRRVDRERKAMALLDADNGIGHLAMKQAAELAMEKAADCGVAWVGVHNNNHAGPAQLYARMPLARDMIGLYVAVGSANHLPPWGGTEMLLSTNPIAVSIPSRQRPPITLDMATTVAAYGKVKTAAQRNETIPEGWMVTRGGQPLTDPKRADEGFLLPIGGAKGYGLSLIFGILAGTLNGAAFGRDVVDFNADFSSVTNTGQFILALDIAAFMDPDAFKAEIDNVWAEMKSSPLMPGFDEIRLPGERAHRTMLERRATGIPIRSELCDVLDRLAAELEIPLLAATAA
ncbi:MAG: Ldh family oxidoreductase [Hyphomicrobiaceae bacterium]